MLAEAAVELALAGVAAAEVFVPVELLDPVAVAAGLDAHVAAEGSVTPTGMQMF